jgi:hypothetical protein
LLLLLRVFPAALCRLVEGSLARRCEARKRAATRVPGERPTLGEGGWTKRMGQAGAETTSAGSKKRGGFRVLEDEEQGRASPFEAPSQLGPSGASQPAACRTRARLASASAPASAPASALFHARGRRARAHKKVATGHKKNYGTNTSIPFVAAFCHGAVAVAKGAERAAQRAVHGEEGAAAEVSRGVARRVAHHLSVWQAAHDLVGGLAGMAPDVSNGCEGVV